MVNKSGCDDVDQLVFVLFSATKIEFYVGDVPDGHTPSLQNARYTRLG